MANTVTKRTIIDGPRHAVVHYFIASDGVTGDATDSVVVDVSTLSPTPSLVTVEQIWYQSTGASAILEFDATTDVGFLAIPADASDHIDYRCFGGIKDNSGSGTTGDILLTTTGLATAGDTISLTIKVRKD